jgi:hypothetical protein
MEIKGCQQDDYPSPLRICRCTLNNRLPEDVLGSWQLGNNPMNYLKATKSASGIVCAYLTIWVGAA